MKGNKYDAVYKWEAIKMIKVEGRSVIDVLSQIGVHIKTLNL